MLSSLKEKPFISILTVHIIHYFAHKEKIQFELITRFLENFTILPLSETDYLLALSLNSKNDFEDTLQIACCISNDCDLFLTLDKKLYKKFVHLGIVKLI
jgi:predicted nucleic acid-binding protein